MYHIIYSPFDKKKYNINSRIGKIILKIYITSLIAGAASDDNRSDSDKKILLLFRRYIELKRAIKAAEEAAEEFERTYHNEPDIPSDEELSFSFGTEQPALPRFEVEGSFQDVAEFGKSLSEIDESLSGISADDED